MTDLSPSVPLAPASQGAEGAFDRALAKRDEVRARLTTSIPFWYWPWAHLATTVGLGVAVFVVAVTHLHAVRPVDWLVVPVTLVLANLFEWRVHKRLLHKRIVPFHVLYDRHTPEHHVVYVEDDMAIRSTREFKLVLLPAFGVAGIIAADGPLAYVSARFLGDNAGWLFLVSSAFALVSYELLHLSYHLPPSSFIGGSRVVTALRRLHAHHHDPRYMQKWNFNVTLPLFDWVFGTLHRPD